LILLSIGLATFNHHHVTAEITEQQMLEILDEYNEKSQILCNRQAIANWAVQTDIGNQTALENQVSYMNSHTRLIK
jgi:hypothetical protein